MSTQALLNQRLEGAPIAYLEPAVRPSLAEAQRYCKALVQSHYENFHVATFFLPALLRPHFDAVYAYCRIADDLGDEVADTATATRLLNTWQEMLQETYDAPERSLHPVFVALRESIVARDLPREPFLALIRAFRADQTKTRFADLSELKSYSRDSANPVGSLVLYLCGHRDPALHALSDQTCTALQLANFWQDVSSDLQLRNRIYLPEDLLQRHGLTEADLRRGVATEAYRTMLRELVEETRAMLLRGAPLIDLVDRELAGTLRLFTGGGLSILSAIERGGFDTLSRRPVVTRAAKLGLLLRAAGSRLGLVRASRGLR